MATLLVPVNIESRYPIIGKTLSQSDKVYLRDTIELPKKAMRILSPRPIATSVIVEEPLPTFGDLGEQFDTTIQKAVELGNKIEESIGGELNMPLDPNNPSVWEAAHQLFSGNFNEITYTMYKKTINYLTALSQTLAESENV